MVVAVDVEDDGVTVWSRTADGDVVREVDADYRPTCYVAAPDDAAGDPLSALAARLADDPKVHETAFDRVHTSLRDDGPTRVCRVVLERPSEVATFAREVRTHHEPAGWAPGQFRLFDVDLHPKFRYCLDEGRKPVPADVTRVRTLSLSLTTERLAAGDVAPLRCGPAPMDARGTDGEDEPLVATDDASTRPGETSADETTVLRRLTERLETVDPDVLVLSSAELVPLVHERAAALDVDCHLGREPGHRQLAGANSYESYGRVGHAAARYDVPGRAIVDRSNSFFWREGKLAGLFDLVERSHKPLQEVAWASIGSVFTAIQIRAARERGVVVPWRAWAAESFTAARTLHDADRGGFTFEPDVGVHEDVVEIDFASLYPNIMCVHDLSPETVRCDCHDTDDVPGLGYSVCPDVETPFVPSVLQPIIDDRAAFKARRAGSDDPAERARLAARISGLKWILVTCFGYQGYRNSKFGRIEVHESINAHARDLLLDAKATLEDAGWRVVHGIVDSLWVTPRVDDREPIEAVCERISADADIALEHESDFAWVAFVPRRDGRAGSLTSYFGRRADPADDEDPYKYRGIEARQRSTPAFVGRVQERLVETLDAHREPEPVCDRLARAIGRLRAGDVDPQDLVVRTAISKARADYDQYTRTVAALERYADHGVDRHPGQDVRFVVVDDDRADRDRVRLPWETIEGYDAEFYATLLVRAAESVVSPLGWDRERIRRFLADGRDLRLSAFS